MAGLRRFATKSEPSFLLPVLESPGKEKMPLSLSLGRAKATSFSSPQPFPPFHPPLTPSLRFEPPFISSLPSLLHPSLSLSFPSPHPPLRNLHTFEKRLNSTRRKLPTSHNKTGKRRAQKKKWGREGAEQVENLVPVSKSRVGKSK